MASNAAFERMRSERGTVLIYVAISLLGLLALGALVVDYGVMWSSRRQAQNSADAGALAGAISLAFVDPVDDSRARQAAATMAATNRVWGLAPNVDPNADVIVGPCPPNSPGLPDTCVRVNVLRNETKDPLPTYFARLVGINQQGVRATATAQVVVANASDCLKPWAVPDRWFENVPTLNGTWNWDSTFDRYVPNGTNAGQLLSPADVYAPPTATSTGSGFRLPQDVGVQVRFKAGNPQQALTAGWFFPIDLPRRNDNTATGGDRYRENIYSCNALPVAIGDTIWNEPGNMIGPTQQGVNDLVAMDPLAHWVSDADGGHIEGSCAQSAPPCAAMSPRLVAIPIFDVDAYSLQDKTSGKFQIRITNILGFFLEGMQGNDVMGRLAKYPGMLRPGVGPLTPESSFLRTVILIR